MKRILWILFFLFLAGIVIAIGVGTWGYYYITRDLPDFHTVEDYRPPAVSKVYSNDGTLIAEFYRDERRYPVKIKDVPVMVRNCFIAAEDASFYQHKGIDPISIVRAIVKNLETGSARQGGSTITQQVVKNMLLTSEKKLKRKLKEAILSFRIEQRLTKDEILEIYLNQIFFGNSAYGIKAAGWVYFRKTLDQLTLGEAAILAGLPKAPSKYSPIKNMKQAKDRQRYVLSQMVKAGFVTPAEAKAAREEEIKVHPAGSKNIFHSPYFVSEVRTVLGAKWKDLNIDEDGLEIHTTLDIKADDFNSKALQQGLLEVDKRRGWRGPIGYIPGGDKEIFLSQYSSMLPERIEAGSVYPALVTQVSSSRGGIRVDLGSYAGSLSLKDAGWAKKRLDKNDRASFQAVEEGIRVGDVIEVSLQKKAEPKKGESEAKDEPKNEPGHLEFILDQTPDVEGASVILDPNSGKVVSIVGGYSYQRSVFNRATQSFRQPGSAFKPVVYLAAVDGFGYTPATIVYDTPRTFRIGEQTWTPANFDEKYMGGITLRTALEKSRNLVSADIISRIGIDPVIQYAKRLGITSKLGRNLSLSLGSSEVTLLEMSRAYGVFAAKGVLFDSSLVTKIVDRSGNVLYDLQSDQLSRAQQAISANSAFLIANMMKGVVDHGTGYRVKEIGRPVAAKTGTSNDQMDAWFIGYTPDWVCGVWVGFDVKKEIGPKETGGKVSAPIWLYAMKDFLKYDDDRKYARLVEDTKKEAERLGLEYIPPPPLEPLDFSVPDGVEPYWVYKDTGYLAPPNAPGAIFEYFLRGTEPSKKSAEDTDTGSYLESPEL